MRIKCDMYVVYYIGKYKNIYMDNVIKQYMWYENIKMNQHGTHYKTGKRKTHNNENNNISEYKTWYLNGTINMHIYFHYDNNYLIFDKYVEYYDNGVMKNQKYYNENNQRNGEYIVS